MFGGDTPEIKSFESFGLSIKKGGGEKSDGGGEFFIGGVGGRLHVVAGGLVIKKQGSSYDLARRVAFWSVMNEIKGGKILGELAFKVVGRKGSEIFVVSEFLLEPNEVLNIGGVLGAVNGETFFRKLVVRVRVP